MSIEYARPVVTDLTQLQPSGKTRYAVIGDPIEHSQAHWFYYLTSLRWQRDFTPTLPGVCQPDAEFYRVQVRAGNLAKSLDLMRGLGFKGVCVTMPLKGEAFALANHATFAQPLAARTSLTWSLTRPGSAATPTATPCARPPSWSRPAPTLTWSSSAQATWPRPWPRPCA